MKRQRHHMDWDVWRKIVDGYVVPYKDVNGRPTLLPHKDGEPLLNKRLTEFLGYASLRVPEANIDIYTHGLLLPRKDGFLDFLGRLPNKVRLLISFHFHNHDGSVNDYTQLTGWLRQVLGGGKPGNVEIILASHLVKPMTAERLEEWAASWRPYGIAVHANCNINPWTGMMKDVATCAFNGCAYWAFDHMFFGATGNVLACCLDLEEEITFGNVMTDEPQAVFDKVRQFYDDQRVRGPLFSVCRDCFGVPAPDRQIVQLGGVKS